MAVPPDHERHRRAWWFQGFGAWLYTPGIHPGVAWPVGISPDPVETVGFLPPSPEVSESDEEAET